MNKSDFCYCKGIKADRKNYNWVIFMQYISLGFSYISFVIKEKIEKEHS